MTVYHTAVMLAGQFALVLMHDAHVTPGSVYVVPQGKNKGIYINPEDAR